MLQIQKTKPTDAMERAFSTFRKLGHLAGGTVVNRDGTDKLVFLFNGKLPVQYPRDVEGYKTIIHSANKAYELFQQ